MTTDLFRAVRRCTFCRKWNATERVPCQAEDHDATDLYRWFCDHVCLANWGTGQKGAGGG